MKIGTIPAEKVRKIDRAVRREEFIRAGQPHFKGGIKPDPRKEESRMACRERVEYSCPAELHPVNTEDHKELQDLQMELDAAEWWNNNQQPISLGTLGDLLQS